MAEITNWVKKIWKNRTTEFPTRRTLMKEDGSSEIVTVTRNEGTVSEEGDAFDADTMNNLEERIDAGFAEVNGKLKTLSAPGTFGCYGVFSNNAWGACNAIIWLPHTANVKLSLFKVTAIGDGNISKDVTASCSISEESRLQYFIVSCTDTSVAGKYVSVEFNMTT